MGFVKQKLLESASTKGYNIVKLMLQTQSEELLQKNVETARERLNYVSLEELQSEIEEHLEKTFKFNKTLSSKFTEVILSVL